MIYVDESIQSDLGYICVGFTYCSQNPDAAVRSAILESGLNPEIDEYKSGIRMAGDSARHALRDAISQIVQQQCQIGVYIASLSERPTLLTAAANTAERIVLQNKLYTPHQVFVDEGFEGKLVTRPDSPISLIPGNNSKEVLGIQLADYVAYHCSLLLKCALADKSKMVSIRETNHPMDGESVELDWIVRTELRRRFFLEHRDASQIEGDDWFYNAHGYGAFYSPNLAPALLLAARRTFDQMYLGCVL